MNGIKNGGEEGISCPAQYLSFQVNQCELYMMRYKVRFERTVALSIVVTE